MQAILTNGRKIFDRQEMPQGGDPGELNAALHTARFSVEGARLIWLPEAPARDTLPVAALRERAHVAFEVEQAQARHQEHLRRVAEVQRQRDELQRLLLAILGEHVEMAAIQAPVDVAELEWMGVRVTLDALTFRVHDYHGGGYELEVELQCPVCHDSDWQSVVSLANLGYLLRQVEDGGFTADCATCQNMAMIADDPFSGE